MGGIRGIAAAIKAGKLASPTIDFKLRTFAVYIRSIARSLQDKYGSDEGLLIAEIIAKQKEANPRAKPDMERVEQSLKRCWATERLLRRTYASGADLDILHDSLHWLPSQAYYSIHAALDALMRCHGLDTKNHQGALNFFATEVCHKLPPFPLGAGCEGYKDNWVFTRFTTPPIPKLATKIASDEPTWCHHLAQGLKTTREADAKDVILQTKGTKKRMPLARQNIITDKRPKTTILNLLWRLRRRSNYGDIDLFMHSAAKSEELDKFANAMVWIVSNYNAAFEALIERRIGKAALEAMMRRFPDSKAGPPDFLVARWRL